MLQGLISGQFNPGQLVAWLIAVTVAITVHEFGHALRAEKAGDRTPRELGRVTLNPLAHYDPIGSTLFLLFGFGWAKPVPVDPRFFRNPRRDGIMVALWGPLSNVCTAVLMAIPLRLGLAGAYAMPLAMLVWANLILAVFNLIPVAPLDGSHVLEGLLSASSRMRLHAFYHRSQGLLLILLLVVLGVPAIRGLVMGVIMIPALIAFRLLCGIPAPL